jgi:hypothetical protein
MTLYYWLTLLILLGAIGLLMSNCLSIDDGMTAANLAKRIGKSETTLFIFRLCAKLGLRTF